MSPEKEQFGHEWFQKELDIEVEILNGRKTYKQKEEEGSEKIKEVLKDIKENHISKVCNTKSKISKKEKYKKMKQDKEEFPKLWELDGKNGVHDLMQKKVPQNIAAPIQRDIYPRQERKDWRRFNPKKDVFRLKSAPDITLNDEQFAKYTKDIMSLSEEDRINLMLTNAERYEAKSKYRRK
jgi:hypothetical protein